MSSEKGGAKRTNGEEIIYRGPKSAEALQRERPRYVTMVTTQGRYRSYRGPGTLPWLQRPRYVTMATDPAEGEAQVETKTCRLGYHSSDRDGYVTIYTWVEINQSLQQEITVDYNYV